MDAWQSQMERTSVEDGPDRRLDGVSDDDLLFLFSYDANQRRRTESRSVAPDTPEADPRLDAGADTGSGVELETPSADPEPVSQAAPNPVSEAEPTRASEAEPVPVSRAVPALANPSPAESQDRAPDEPGPTRAILRLGAEPVVVSVSEDARASFELSRWIEAVTPRTGLDSATRPLVMRFAPRPEPGDDTVDAAGERPGRTASIARDPTPRAEPFRWRRMFASAALWGGLGCATLLVIHWISR